nr:histone H2A.v1-like [Drosophila bipectinata]
MDFLENSDDLLDSSEEEQLENMDTGKEAAKKVNSDEKENMDFLENSDDLLDSSEEEQLENMDTGKEAAKKVNSDEKENMDLLENSDDLKMEGENLKKNEDSGEEELENMDTAKEPTKKKISGKGKEKPLSRSARAGLKFPVGRIHQRLKKFNNNRIVQSTAAVCCAGVLEYLTSEVIGAAGMAMNDANRKRITTHHLQAAIRGDADLKSLVQKLRPRREKKKKDDSEEDSE